MITIERKKAHRIPTQRQKKVARLLIENMTIDKPLNAGEIVEKSRYSHSMKIKPGQVLESEGVQQELKILGFDEESAKKVVSAIMNSDKVNPADRLKATDQVFKIHGSYAPEKHENINLNIDASTREKSKQAIRELIDGNP